MNTSTWDPETSVVITCSLTTGSCFLTAYRLTPPGIEWGNKNKETTTNPAGYGTHMFEKVQMILSDKFLGFFMVPEGGIWNYNFNGINFSANLRYTLALNNPRDFYNEMHRPSHFLDFTRREAEEEEAEMPEKENHFQ